MMRKLLLFNLLISTASFAMAQTEFTLVASELEPHTEGFYIGGETYNWDGAPQEFFANGCPGEVINGREIDPEDYERRDPSYVTYDLHNETGEQFGFTYYNAMILPDCNQKYINDEEQLEEPVSAGFIQLAPSVNKNSDEVMDEDSIKLSYIQSPLISNLQSITVETSADISIQQDRRYIPYLIEVSLDSGATWELIPYIEDLVNIRSGNRATYDSENLDLKEMSEISQEQNIVVRLITNLDDPDLEAYKGQYVNVHKLVVVADSAQEFSTGGGGGGGTILASEVKTDPIQLHNGYASVKEGIVTAYSISGQFYGSGKSIKLGKGFYILTTDKGFRKKIFIK